MKAAYLFILVTISLTSFSQRKNREIYYAQKKECIKTGDSLELSLSNNQSLTNLTDTINNMHWEETSSWRDDEYISYYYTDKNLLKKIEIFSRRGRINIYFKDELVRKIHLYSFDSLVNSQYYFYEKDNSYSEPEIASFIKDNISKKESFDLLIMAKKLYLNFRRRIP